MIARDSRLLNPRAPLCAPFFKVLVCQGVQHAPPSPIAISLPTPCSAFVFDMPSDLNSSLADLLPVSYPDLDDNWAVNPLKAINTMETANEEQAEFTLDDLCCSACECTPVLLAGLSPNELGQYAHRVCFALVRYFTLSYFALADSSLQGLLPQLEVFEADSIFEEFWVPYSERAVPAAAQAYRRLYLLTSRCVCLFTVEDAIANDLADTPLDIALTRDLLDIALWDRKSLWFLFSCFCDANAFSP